MKIEELQVDASARLTEGDKKVLTKIIDSEFTNKESLYHQLQEKEKEKILEAYKKQVGFDKLKGTISKAKAAYKLAEEELEKVGLDENGRIEATTYWSSRLGRDVTNYKARAVEEKMAVIEKNAPSMNLKSKLITRLQLATTKGEALVIMKEILGNAVLPTINANQITYTTKK